MYIFVGIILSSALVISLVYSSQNEIAVSKDMNYLWLSNDFWDFPGRRPWFDSWVGKFPWRMDRLPTPVFLGFPGDSDDKESACNAGDMGLIPGLGRSP